MGNFSFFKDDLEYLGEIANNAERYIYDDSNTALFKIRQFLEELTKVVIAEEKVENTESLTQLNKLNKLNREGVVPTEILDYFHFVRKHGNKATHIAKYEHKEIALEAIKFAHKISIWFMEVYVDWEFNAESYLIPDKNNSNEQLKIENDRLEKEFEEQIEKIRSETVDDSTKRRRKEKSKRYIRDNQMNEKETRLLIDQKLQEADWEVDTEKLNFQKYGTLPEKNKDMIISEWPTRNGRVDYAMFIDQVLVGVIEAKSKKEDISSVLDSQSKEYSRNAFAFEGIQLVDFEGNEEYKVPFIYATNGRPFLEQVKEKSGVWFWDARIPDKHASTLEGWHSPKDLKKKLETYVKTADEELQKMSFDNFGLRYYQKEAIKSVEIALSQNQSKILVAMATGTGKTRTAIALTYRLIKTRKVRRILFLVDRKTLGKQTYDAMQDTKLVNNMSLSQLYDIVGLNEVVPNDETKVQIATVQGMVRRLFYGDKKTKPSVGQYDLIIVDEAHRGYINDKEMTDEELEFHNQEDYVSQYRRVLDYFDASVLGLTATPALHTTEIFGMPIYKYSYNQAVVDGFLIDYEPPYLIETDLNQKGIHYTQGDEIQFYNPNTHKIDLEIVEDEINFDVEQFNRKVRTEKFNETVIKELVNYIDLESEDKTLVFAMNNEHADMVVRLFKQSFGDIGEKVSDDLVTKITSSVYKPDEKIIRFKNELIPKIVVTVDLLSTGVDVPEITNIVFLRAVKSRILFEQMLGRATRLAPHINKDVFRIFDAVGVYHKLEEFSEMKPVVKSQSKSIEDLKIDILESPTIDEAEFHKKQLIAKIQRKKQKMDNIGTKAFESISDGKTIDQFIDELQAFNSEDIKVNEHLISFFEDYLPEKKRIINSEHEDNSRGIKRSYGKENISPADYLDEFDEYIKNNINKIPALQIVTSRPKDLTKEDLKQLKYILKSEGYDKENLKSAWRNVKQEEIAADLISYIRQAALGIALEDKETRVNRAMQKVYGLHDWTPKQKRWLDRIKKQLIQEPILGPQPEKAFEEEPFKSQGGYRSVSKIIGKEEVNEIVELINTELYIS